MITVVIPLYNKAPFIGRTLDSVAVLLIFSTGLLFYCPKMVANVLKYIYLRPISSIYFG